MNKHQRPFPPGEARKLALVDTAGSILLSKGSQVWQVSPDSTVFEAIAEMARRGVGALLVMSGDSLVGIVSERDYARKVILRGRSSNDTFVREIMTRSPVSVTPLDTIDHCMRVMTQRRVRHLPVIDQGKVTGIVSIGDLVKAFIASQAFTIDQLHTYITTRYPA